MKLVIEVTVGTPSGSKYALRDGQQLTFGRTSWSDVSFKQDERMSGSHFSVVNDGQSCLLRDMGSTNGTQLNGEFIKQAMLTDGDAIKAGKTEFAVSITGQPIVELEDDPVGQQATKKNTTFIRDVTRSVLLTGNQCLNYFVEPSASQLVAYRHFPTEEEMIAPEAATETGPMLVFELLSQKLNPTFVVDFRKFGEPPPKDHPAARPLFDWLPAESSETLSPWVIPLEEPSLGQSWIQKGWDHDAVLCFFSESLAEETIEYLAGQVRPEGQQNMLGWCWPSVISQLLAFREEAFVEELLGPTLAVLLELPDLPGGWQLFALPSLKDSVLSEMGFQDLGDQDQPAEPAEVS